MASPLSIEGNIDKCNTDTQIGWYKTTEEGSVGTNLRLNNSSGFNAIPEGLVNVGRGFQFLGYSAHFWTSTYNQQGNANSYRITNNSVNLNKTYYTVVNQGLSVRFVRDN